MVNNVVRVCAQSDIAPETVRAFEVGDKRLAVFNLGGKFYVTDDECTHASASLADGIPVDLRDTLTGLDDSNIQLLITAIRRTSGKSSARAK